MRSRLLFAVLVLVSARSASAFNEATQFFAASAEPHSATLGASAEGIYFTGAPRYSGLDCSSCHTGGPRKVGLQLDADDATLFSRGYVPGQTYELAVTLTHESEGLEYTTPTCTETPGTGDTFTYEQCNLNNFALEIDDGADQPLEGTGVFCAAPPDAGGCPTASADADEVIVAPDGDAVLANHAHSMSMPYELLHNDVTGWHLWWTAPPAGTGALKIYVAAVDGNGGGGVVTDDQDPYGDDAVRAEITVAENGGAPAPRSTSGCSLAPGERGTSALVPALCLLALALSRRRVLATIVCLAGCSTGPEMLPGSDCQSSSCHSAGGGAQQFSVSGTVYPNGAAPSDVGLVGATVHITDATGATMDLVTNNAGNFYVNDRDNHFTFPLVVSVERGDAMRSMEPTVLNGSCNHCHGLPPKESAQGRVYIPSPPP